MGADLFYRTGQNNMRLRIYFIENDKIRYR